MNWLKDEKCEKYCVASKLLCHPPSRWRSQGAIMSVKKEASGRRSVQVEVEVPGSTQSAVARRSAEAQLRTLIQIRARASTAHRRNATVAAKAPADRP